MMAEQTAAETVIAYVEQQRQAKAVRNRQSWVGVLLTFGLCAVGALWMQLGRSLALVALAVLLAVVVLLWRRVSH